MGNNSHKPAIRFQGFTDAWEQRKLGEIVRFSKGTGYSKGDLKDSGTPIILYGRLYTKYETVISEVDTFVDAKDNSVYSSGGEVIVPASGETAEEISIASVVEKPRILLGGDLNIITPSSELDSAFLALTISNGKPHDDMARVAQGKTVVHLHNSDLEKIDLSFPSHEEQVQISNCFNTLDNLITLHQRKYEKLITVKKSMLEKMFPRDGSNNPEIRFTGFTDRWEQRKLGELAEIKDSARIPNNEWSNSGVPYIRASDITNEDISGVLFISSESYDYYKARTGAPAQGDVLFNGGGEIGKAFLNTENTPIYVQGGAVLYVRTSKSTLLDGQYLKTFFETPMAQCYIDIASAGGTMKHFTLKPSQEMPIQLPEMREQIQIGRCFRNIDNLITLHHLKLEKLKNIKQSLLQNMFV